MESRPYAAEEVLSFDRIRRAIVNRVVETAEHALEKGAPLDRQNLAELVTQEWKAVKDAVRTSPLAKERARERIRGLVGGILDGHFKSDRAELEALGVQEKTI